MFALPILSLLYAALFNYAYVDFINPDFEYAHFLYNEPSILSLAVTYAMVVAPVVGYRPASTPAAYGAALIYTLCYVPAQLIVLFMWERTPDELLMLQGLLSISMFVLLRASAIGSIHYSDPKLTSDREGKLLNPAADTVVAILTGLASVVLLYSYRETMAIVALDDVYDLRFVSAQTAKGVVSDYSLVFLTYTFLPFYYARGIFRRSLPDIGIGMAISLLIYASVGAKTAVLMGLIVFVIYLLIGRSGTRFLPRLLVLFTTATAILVSLPNDDDYEWISFLKSTFFVRTLGIGGWNISTYYEYFTTNGYTYFTHIGVVNALFGTTRSAAYSMGQLIGLQYTGTEESNFNANFWASDGVAAVGVGGILLVTAVLCIVWFAINRAVRDLSPRFVAIWLTGFWLALLNSPLSTSLLSGGGLLILLILTTNSYFEERAAADGTDDLEEHPAAPGSPAE